MTENIFTLTDGRKLCYAIYGPLDGKPVLYFHGTPSSRLEPQLLDGYNLSSSKLFQETNIKLIAVDRPGMGLSDYNPKGSFLSFADDAAELAKFLGVQSCPVLCWSGGGPYALAIAYQHPSLISSVHIICGFTRCFDAAVLAKMGMNKWYFRSAKYAAPFLQATMNLLKKKKIKSSIPQKITGLSYADYKLLKDPGHLNALSNLTMKEACRNGAKGAVHEAGMYFKNFGFALSSIQQPVHYWWGTADRAVIQLHAEAIETEVQNQKLHYQQGEGHLSIYTNNFREVLQVVLTADM